MNLLYYLYHNQSYYWVFVISLFQIHKLFHCHWTLKCTCLRSSADSWRGTSNFLYLLLFTTSLSSNWSHTRFTNSSFFCIATPLIRLRLFLLLFTEPTAFDNFFKFMTSRSVSPSLRALEFTLQYTLFNTRCICCLAKSRFLITFYLLFGAIEFNFKLFNLILQELQFFNLLRTWYSAFPGCFCSFQIILKLFYSSLVFLNALCFLCLWILLIIFIILSNCI